MVRKYPTAPRHNGTMIVGPFTSADVLMDATPMGHLMPESGSTPKFRRSDDEQDLTAVVEFLSAFVLFLVIVSAFLALSQLKLGSNVADADRFDQMAIDSLERLTDSKGHVVLIDEGVRDISNSTDDWHHFNASILLESDLLPAIGNGNGRLDSARITALGNVTEDKLTQGLGVDGGLSLNLTIIVIESDNVSNVGELVFSDGSSRSGATRSSTASRQMYLDNELVRVTVEIHNAGREPSGIRITEIMVDPLNGPPEWIEIENPDGFAMNLSGWSLARPGVFTMIGDGALGAGEKLICTGNSETQNNPNGVMMYDMASSGMLGTGAIDSLDSESDQIILGWTRSGTILTQNVMVISWDSDWNIPSNHSLTYNFGGNPSDSSNWTSMNGGTPGW